MSDHTDMNIAWLDFETTGSDERDGSLLEVGVIVTTPALSELSRRSWLVEPDLDHVATMAKVVRDMHTRNGLLDEIDRKRADYLAGRDATPGVLTPAEVDAKLAAWLAYWTVRGRVILAGSGVGHFDSRWLRLHLPKSAKAFTYWPLDVGVVRRFLITAGVTPHRPAEPDTKAHRALDDAEDHLAEARHYLAMFRPLTGHVIGQRVTDHDEPGTIVVCGEPHGCGGSGQLHQPDQLPPYATPTEG